MTGPSNPPSRESILRRLRGEDLRGWWTRLLEPEAHERAQQVARRLEAGPWLDAFDSVSHGWVAFTSRGYALGRPPCFHPYEWEEGAVQEVLAEQGGSLLRIRWTTIHPDNLVPPYEQLRALPGSSTEVVLRGARQADALALAGKVNALLEKRHRAAHAEGSEGREP